MLSCSMEVTTELWCTRRTRRGVPGADGVALPPSERVEALESERKRRGVDASKLLSLMVLLGVSSWLGLLDDKNKGSPSSVLWDERISCQCSADEGAKFSPSEFLSCVSQSKATVRRPAGIYQLVARHGILATATL